MRLLKAVCSREVITFALRAHAGLAAAFLLGLLFSPTLCQRLMETVNGVFASAGAPNPTLILTSPAEWFTAMWLSIPLAAAVVLATPWVLYQFWRYVREALAHDERDWARRFLLSVGVVSWAAGFLGYWAAHARMKYDLHGAAQVRLEVLTVQLIAAPFLEHLLGVVALLEFGVLLVFSALLAFRRTADGKAPPEAKPCLERDKGPSRLSTGQAIGVLWGILAAIGALLGMTANIQFGACGVVMGVIGWRVAKRRDTLFSAAAVLLSAIAVVVGLQT